MNALLVLLVQQAPPPNGAWPGWIRNLAEEPALLELLLVLLLGAITWVVGLRLSRLVHRTRTRAALEDWLLGAEQALAGDLKGAAKRLHRVLADDPENHHARLLLAEVLAELGEPAAAHKEHVVLQSAFGLQSARNDVALARSLLEAGRPAEAAEAATRALADRPNQPDALRLLFQAQLAAGLPADAARSGERLLQVLPLGPDRDAVSERVTGALATTARTRLLAGDVDGARALAAQARDQGGDAAELRLLEANLAVLEGGTDAVIRRLAPPAAPGFALTAPAPAELAVADPAPPAAIAIAGALQRLVPQSPFVCRACGGPLAHTVAHCPHCGTAAPARPVEPALLRELESPALAIDEIDEAPEHARRLLARAQEGETAAEDELVEMGPAAVAEILAASTRRDDPVLEVRVLQRMGSAILPALFAAYATLRESRILRLVGLFGSELRTNVVGRVVQKFGREALPYFDQLRGTGDRDLRKLVIDFHLGLGDQELLERVLEQFPPLEVIHRLNQAPPDVLVPLLAQAPAGAFLAEGVLVAPTFTRETELVAALEQAPVPQVLVKILERRGPARALIRALIDRLGDPRCGELAHRVLGGYGLAALEHLLSAFADVDRPPAAREQVRDRIVALGAATVESISGVFGSAPSALDDELVALLVALGPAAVGPLVEAYQRGGLLERLGLALVTRYTHRRQMLLRALAGIGGNSARDALQRLRERESDPNLKLRIGQSLNRIANLAGDDEEVG